MVKRVYCVGCVEKSATKYTMQKKKPKNILLSNATKYECPTCHIQVVVET